jgi:hypothetical protein
VLDQESVRELAAGQRLQLVFDKVTVAEIVPVNLDALAEQQRQHVERRRLARERLLAIMDRGIDMGGFKITNRDELYDRD